MIFDSIMFHNVAELEESNKGYKMWRVPQEIREQLNDKAKNFISGCATGVE